MTANTRKQHKYIRVALDIGTTKVVTVVAEIDGDKLNVLNFGAEPCNGLQKGIVVNIENTITATKKSIEHAQLATGIEIGDVIVSISGKHIGSISSNGLISVKSGEITRADVERVLESAQSVAIPDDRTILHVLPRQFKVDSHTNIKQPIGMTGSRLACDVHIITGEFSVISNISKCVDMCGVNVSSLVLQPLASGYAVLTEDERNMGVCMVDIGGGTSDIAVFKNGSVVHTAVIPLGGNQVTGDILFSLRTSFDQAELIKTQYACALESTSDPDGFVEIKDPINADQKVRRISYQNLAKVVEARYEEIFILIKKNLGEAGLLSDINAGIVLTGGGSRVKDCQHLAEEIFHLPVRLGLPAKIKGHEELLSNPAYSTAVGLLHFDMLQKDRFYQNFKTLKNPSMKNWWKRFSHWISENF